MNDLTNFVHDNYNETQKQECAFRIINIERDIDRPDSPVLD